MTNIEAREEWGLRKSYLTAEQVATELGVHIATLRRWRSLGEGPPETRIGRQKILFHRDAVLTWLESRQAEVAA